MSTAINDILSRQELDELLGQVNQQLHQVEAIALEGQSRTSKGLGTTWLAKLASQATVVQQETHESVETFLRKFALTARKDLCEEGGMLYEQWKKWGDLNNPEALERIGMVLLAMGFTGGVMRSLLVAVTVIIVHLGARTICEQYGPISPPDVDG